RRRHTRCLSDWSSDVCSSDLDVNQIEEVRHDTASIVRADGAQHPLLRQLVQSVERKRKKENEPHVRRLLFQAERNGSMNPAALSSVTSQDVRTLLDMTS